MYNKNGNVFNSNIDKVLKMNEIKNMINDKENLVNDKNKELSNYEKLELAINKFNYYFGTQNDKVILNNNSTILSNTNTKKIYSNRYKNQKESNIGKKALEILNNADFFNTVSNSKNNKQIMTETINLDYKNMRNIRTNFSVPQLEKVYNNFKALQNNGGLLIGFDTETLGNITDKVWNPNGITEFAMVVNDLKSNKNNEINVLLSSQIKDVEHNKDLIKIKNILQQKNGLEILKQNNDLYVTAQRFSMYGHKDTKIKFNEKLGYAQVTSFAGEKAIKVGDIESLENGVKKLTEFSKKIKINNKTGLHEDVSKVIESLGYMVEQSNLKKAMVVNYNGQIFDIPVLNKFIKNIYKQQIDILNNKASNKVEIENAKKGIRFLVEKFGNNPSFNLNEDYTFDAFAAVKAGLDIFGESKIYNTTKVGKKILNEIGSHTSKQENIARNFYQETMNKSVAHTAIEDTKILNSFFTKNMENSKINTPLIDYLMKGVGEEGIIGKVKNIDSINILPNQYFMSVQSDWSHLNGKKIFNFLQDSNGRVITSTSHVIGKDGKIIYDRITGENPTITKNQFYKVNNIQKIDVSKIDKEFANLVPEYGLNNIYHMQLKLIHGDKYEGTYADSTLNLLFGSKTEMESWFSSNFSYIGEKSPNGSINLNKKAINDYQIRQLSNGKAILNEDFFNKNSDEKIFNYLLNVYEENAIDRKVTNNFLFGNKSVSRISGTLDFYNYLKKNNLENLSSLDLAKLYFNEEYGKQLGISKKDVKKIKSNLTKNLGFEKKVDGEKRLILLDSTARNALFAYENVRDQAEYYNNLLSYSFGKVGKTSLDNKSYSVSYKSLNKAQKENLSKTFNFMMDQTNQYIASGLSNDKINTTDIRDILINGKKRLENTNYYKSKYDFILNKNFYDTEKATKIFDLKEPISNIVTFNLDKENPRNSFINTLLNEKFNNVKQFNDVELSVYRRSVFVDFIKNISEKGNEDLFNNITFKSLQGYIKDNESNFSLNVALDMLQKSVSDVKQKDINAGIKKVDTVISRKVNDKIIKLRNELTTNEINMIGNNMPIFKDLNKNQKGIQNEINYLLNNFFMPAKEDYLSKVNGTINKKAANGLYDNIYQQLKTSLTDIFEAAGIAKVDIQYDNIQGKINLIKDGKSIELDNLPKIIEKEGTLFAKSGNQTFALKHTLNTVYTKDGPKLKAGTNLDLNFSNNKNFIFNKIKQSVEDNSFTLDYFKRQVGFSRKDFYDSPTIQNFTLANYLTANNTIDFRGADEIIPYIFGVDSEGRSVLDKLLEEGKLNVEDLPSILEGNIPEELKKGALAPVYRMYSNLDAPTIFENFAEDEFTKFLIKNSNSLGKETRIAEGNRTIGDNLYASAFNLIDNGSLPTLISSENSKWIKSDKIEEAMNDYKGFLIKGSLFTSEQNKKNIYKHIEDTSMDYVHNFSHRQLYTGVLGANSILYKEQNRVINNFITDEMSKDEIDEVVKLYDKAALQVRDNLFEQAKILDPLLFEKVYNQVPQDIQVIGKNLDIKNSLEKIYEHNNDDLMKILKDSKIEDMIDSIGNVTIKDNKIKYTKGKGTIVKKGDLIIPYESYGDFTNSVSNKFSYGTLGFTIKDKYNNELTEKEINKVLNDNASKIMFSNDKHENIKNFISFFNDNDNYNIGFEIENINKVEVAKMSDNSAEKSMVRFIYGKTGEFDKSVEKYFKITGGNDLLYNTVLTNKAIDSYISDVEKKFGIEKADSLLKEAGLKSIEELKNKIQEEQFKYRNIIFGEKGIFKNISGLANDNLVKHKNQGARLTSTLSQAISLVGKYENGGIEDKNSYELGLNKVLDFINKGYGKYDFIKRTELGITNDYRERYTKDDLAFVFKQLNSDTEEFNYVDLEKAKDLIKGLNDKFLSNAKEEDKLYHKNVKILTDKNTYEKIDEYYGNLYFYNDKNGEKIGLGSVGIVNKAYNIDSEFQSSVSKDYLDSKKRLLKLKEYRDELLNQPLLNEENIDLLEKIYDSIEKHTLKINSMESYSRQMKIDDQARNILSNSALNDTTTSNLEKWISGKNKKHYSNLLSEATEGMIREEEGKIVISDLVKSNNVNKPILNEIRKQITYDELNERKLTKQMLKMPKYQKYEDIFNRVSNLGLELGEQHAQLFYEGIQAVKAAEFNNSNAISIDTLLNKYNFELKNIEDYVSTRGRADNKVLESMLHKATLIDLGEDFKDNRYIAIPALGKQSGTKEIRQDWLQSFNKLSKTYREYSDLQGLQNDNNNRRTTLFDNIIKEVENIKEQTNSIFSKDTMLTNLSKVEVNMPYSRVKLFSTMSGSIIESPFINDLKKDKKYVSNLGKTDFRRKAIINGKTIAEWEKGGIDNGGVFFDYRIASESEFRNAGYFDKDFMENIMGFKKYKDSSGKIITAEDQMREYLETHGTMDFVDRYPNIKDQSIYTGKVYLNSNIADNATAVAGHSLLKVNGDTDGDMVSTLFLEYKGANFAGYEKQREEAKKHVYKTMKLSDKKYSPDEIEKEIKKQTVQNSHGYITSDVYDLFRGKEIEMVYRAVENRDIVEKSLIPTFFKESKRNYKGMALRITKDEISSNSLAEVEGGKSILGKVKLFNQTEHVKSGFFIKNNEDISKYMDIAYKNKNLVKNPNEYKYLESFKDAKSIHDFGNNQSEALDEVLSILELAKQKNEKNPLLTDEFAVTDELYKKAEKDIFDRIRANRYVESEISKGGKDAIGQINAALYPIRQASEEYFGKADLKTYNPTARKIISDMSDQIEQNIISYKKVSASYGDKRLITFMDIMNSTRNGQEKGFSFLKGGNKDKLIEWTNKYLNGDIADEMYENLSKNDLLSAEMIRSKDKYQQDFIKQGMSQAEADSSSKIKVLTEEYTKYVNEMYSNEMSKSNINAYSNFNRRSGKVTKSRDIKYLSEDSHMGVIQSIVKETDIGEKELALPNHKDLTNKSEELTRLRNEIKNLSKNESKSIKNKIIEDGIKSLESVNSSGLAMGILGLASGLLISGFAGGNPLNNPKPDKIENSPKTESMSVPEFFENQGGYVTGNSQTGYILNLKADTNKGQRYLKRALKQAVSSTTGGAVSINMNFKSNNNGGYSDQDIQKLISNYI